MRTLPPLALAAALAGTLLLTACDDDGAGADDVKNADRPAASACALGDMGVQIGAGAAPAAGDTGTVTVTLTNKGAQCTLKGFPGVDLMADDSTTSVSPDEGVKAQPLTLGKGGTTSFTITYVRGEAGSPKSLPVRKASFTLPGATEDAHTLTWSYGEVARRDGESGAAQASVSGFESSGD
ncbi:MULTISPECIES: DUF4232 domain-containing protein [Streptomyces]|uniref:DUF4232 domain-containing protein n=1 Tax=Streptomyces koelreuteriae TaxID=2838015 RepID=A0ABX8FS55_9ACTN|nr:MULTISPECIES: DUF4232 domain-containing protein [Streptomyces]QWB24028.1 DUF4232 domain-containing protein [Streptomyces koelreuteriae]UUA07011.1 DUF4232 domain-containing protein [Streptomyces koelreuteriae]UUA14640.1 DUF4232 domain-containing protein [Streptomyces sp. CRCS-T-1]